MIRRFIPVIALAVGLGSATSPLRANSAAPIEILLEGITKFDGWADLTSFNYPGYSSGNWPQPIESNQPGSGSALFDKTEGPAYPGSVSVYSPFNQSWFSVYDNNPVANLQTVVFQIEIGEGPEGDLIPEDFPTLTYNEGETAGVSLILSELLVQEFDGYWPTIDGPKPVYRNLWIFQWTFSEVPVEITSFAIHWGVEAHSQIYALQLNQSDTFSPAIPEPSTIALCMAGLAFLCWTAKRRKQTQIC